MDHAPEIPYLTAAYEWMERGKILEKIGGRNDCQIVIVGDKGKNDAPAKLAHLIEPFPFAQKYPIATTRIERFPGDEETLLWIENEAPQAKHIVIVASPRNSEEIIHIQEVAKFYKEQLNALYVTFFATYLTGARQDKNCNSDKSFRPTPVNIDSILASMPDVDSFFCVEPHSFRSQDAAYRIKKPFCPVTPWKYLIDRVIGREIKIDDKMVSTKENTIAVRPDKGRNIAAGRISNHYELEAVAFDKTRTSTETTLLSLSEEDQKKVRGKYCIVYDDELNTNETVGNIADKLKEYGALGLIIIGVHGKFTGKWKEYIKNPMIKKIFVSDSRTAIGDIQPNIDCGKIEILPLGGLISGILQADANGVNFWLDPNWAGSVLQTNGLDK